MELYHVLPGGAAPWHTCKYWMIAGIVNDDTTVLSKSKCTQCQQPKLSQAQEQQYTIPSTYLAFQ